MKRGRNKHPSIGLSRMFNSSNSMDMLNSTNSMAMPISSNSMDRGSIESGLTIIPTTAFFLLILQLVLSGSLQVMETMNLQSHVSRVALGQQDSMVFNGINKSELRQFQLDQVKYESGELDLPGGGKLFSVNSVVDTPHLSNLLGFKPKVRAQAIAIEE